jgi:hypothetical protein
MLTTGSPVLDAEQAFSRMSRSRRRAAVARRLRRRPPELDRLPVVDETAVRGAPRPGIHEIPLDAIRGTLEPGRARTFDREFRPADSARERWTRVWLAHQRGAALPPISLVDFGNGYAIRDGHHRVSVALARGAVTIDATVELA